MHQQPHSAHHKLMMCSMTFIAETSRVSQMQLMITHTYYLTLFDNNFPSIQLDVLHAPSLDVDYNRAGWRYKDRKFDVFVSIHPLAAATIVTRVRRAQSFSFEVEEHAGCRHRNGRNRVSMEQKALGNL